MEGRSTVKQMASDVCDNREAHHGQQQVHEILNRLGQLEDKFNTLKVDHDRCQEENRQLTFNNSKLTRVSFAPCPSALSAVVSSAC